MPYIPLLFLDRRSKEEGLKIWDHLIFIEEKHLSLNLLKSSMTLFREEH
jgi:hypothetical protein